MSWHPCCCVASQCCPGEVIGGTLTATVTVTSGSGCSGLDGLSFAITGGGGSLGRSWAGEGGTTFVNKTRIDLTCVNGAWTGESPSCLNTYIISGGTFTTVSCDPLHVTRTGCSVIACPSTTTGCVATVDYTE